MFLENLVQRLLTGVGDCSIPTEPTKDLGAGHSGWAWYRRESKGQKVQWVHFPLPRVNTFRRLDRFLAIWSYELFEYLERIESAKREADVESWRATVSQRWRKAAWIATGPETRYEDFVLSNETSEVDDSGEWNEAGLTEHLFAHPFLDDWVTWSAL